MAATARAFDTEALSERFPLVSKPSASLQDRRPRLLLLTALVILVVTFVWCASVADIRYVAASTGAREQAVSVATLGGSRELTSQLQVRGYHCCDMPEEYVVSALEPARGNVCIALGDSYCTGLK